MEFWVSCGNDSTLNHWSILLSRLTMKLFHRASVLRSNFGTSPMYSWFPRLSISMKIRGCSTALLDIIEPTVTSHHHFWDQLRAGGCDPASGRVQRIIVIVIIVIIAPYPWCWYIIYDYDDYDDDDDDDNDGVASKHSTYKNGNVRDGLWHCFTHITAFI